METLASIRKDSWLSWFFRGTLVLIFFIIVGRLIELQVIKGAYFRSLSEGNRIRRIPISAPRGRILARGGEVLVGDVQVKKRISFNPYSGFEKLDDLSGAGEGEVITEWVRSYPLGAVFAHVSGYLGEIDESEVDKINPECPEKGPRKEGNLTGRDGLEAQYQCTLSGIEGEELVEVDTSGKKVRSLGRHDPIPGEDIKTTINYELQKKVASLMEGKKGAIIVTDPEGEVLALVSSPSFDPNLFIKEEASQRITDILNDINLPLYNRAIGGQFHPGSTFKPLVALAALSEGKIDESFTYDDPGVIKVNIYSYSNWYYTQYGKTEGNINLVRALARSTDTFFYKIGEIVGVEAIVKWSEKLGLNRESGIDIPGEISGLVPTPEWKKRVKGERWFLGNTYHLSIGQGDLALTPIALNRYISAIASGGSLCRPRLVDQGRGDGCTDLSIKEQNLNLVREGMVQACAPGGTGFTFFDFAPSTACKTGTAETNEDGKIHAWFSAFAPQDDPEIVATVLVEGGGEGSKVAGPIAREIFNFWFHHP